MAAPDSYSQLIDETNLLTDGWFCGCAGSSACMLQQVRQLLMNRLPEHVSIRTTAN